MRPVCGYVKPLFPKSFRHIEDCRTARQNRNGSSFDVILTHPLASESVAQLEKGQVYGRAKPILTTGRKATLHGLNGCTINLSESIFYPLG